MRRWWLIALLLLAAPLRAQLDVPAMTGDPACNAGEYKYWANTTSHKIRKCENGVISDMDASVAATGTNFGPKGTEYDPDRAPSTSDTDSACTDEFNNGNTATWTWLNQGTNTITYSGDFAHLAGPAQTATWRGVYCTPNNGADWTFTAKLTIEDDGSNTATNNAAGIWLIDGGTPASPTTVVYFFTGNAGALGRGAWTMNTAANYTTIPGTSDGTTGDYTSNGATRHSSVGHVVCLQLRYVVATKIMTFRWAGDCRNWQFNASTSTRTFTNAPGMLGFAIDNGNAVASSIVVQWARFNVSSAGNSGEYPPGKWPL